MSSAPQLEFSVPPTTANAQVPVIIVVDDEAFNRDMLSRRLERAGYRALQAENGATALRIIAETQVDLVLLDQMMPGMSGSEVLRTLRGNPATEKLPVLMVTALSDSEQVVRALSQGANDYLTKPIDIPVALARIKTQLDRKRVEDELRRSEERYALATRGTNDGLWDWDIASEKVYFSPRWKTILGIAESEPMNTLQDWLLLVHPNDRGRVEEELRACFVAGSTDELVSEHRILHRNGLYRWVLVRAVTLRNPGGTAVRMAGSLCDITQRKAFDPLTGLPNREMFMERLEQNFEKFKEDPRHFFSVMFLDLDRFKVVNDSMGHPVGDQLLIGIAKRLMYCVRSGESPDGVRCNDLVARIGGDEFTILSTGLPNIDIAWEIADRILTDVRKPFRMQGRDIYTNLSIGIAPVSSEYQHPEDIIRDADTAMYRAKAEGRGCSVIFDSRMRQEAVERLEIESGLRLALERNELEVHYQPKVHIGTSELVGFEVLMRWRHPTKGLISPTHFIPVAEETGLIIAYGIWVLREACRQLREWNLKFGAQPPLEVSVNLSVRQFSEPDLPEQVAAVINETGIEPSSLQLEITESVLIGNPISALEMLRKLKRLGVGLKIDDFGTGYSSLSYLTQLPLDCLKIDRSFVSRMCQDKSSSEVVKTVVELAKSLGMSVVAEGVEESDQVRALNLMGCEYAQGYYYSKPMEPVTAESYIATHKTVSEEAEAGAGA